MAGSVSRTEVAGLGVLLGGRAPANPAELLSSDRHARPVHEAEGIINFVVLDFTGRLY